jgi:hypothetical protein
MMCADGALGGRKRAGSAHDCGHELRPAGGAVGSADEEEIQSVLAVPIE